MNCRLPVLPTYQYQFIQLNAKHDSRPPCVLDVPYHRLTDSGSAAIGILLDRLRVAPDDAVLVPAYHCLEIIEPIARRGVAPIFYEVNEDLSVSLESVLNAVTSKTKAVLVPHFFGAIQDLGAVRDACDQMKLILIEDCAHCFYGGSPENPVGLTGDYSIASTRKFFPGVRGGCLLSRSDTLSDLSVQGYGLISEISFTLDVLEESQFFGKLGVLNPVVYVLSAARSHIKSLGSVKSIIVNREHTAPHEARQVSTEKYDSMTKVSSLMLSMADHERIIAARWRNFNYLNESLNGVAGLRKAPVEVCETGVPYMFPLLCENPSVYLNLKKDGWPIWRWDFSDQRCRTSAYYADHLFQIPCHQSLNEEEIKAYSNAILSAHRTLRTGSLNR